MFSEATKKLRTPKKFVWVPKNASKLIFGPQKMGKMIFFKKPEFCDLTEHQGWFPQWPGSICSIPIPPVNSFYMDFGFG